MNTNTHTTRMSRHIGAPRAKVYEALIHADAIARWKVPTGMRMHIHVFEGFEGGSYRILLTYDAPDRAGKTSGHTDTYHGRFKKLVQNELVVEVVAFETTDPSLQGEMIITTRLSDAPDGGTELTAVHEGLPSGVAPADNELGWRISLDKLAALLRMARNFIGLN